jgi:hypothetical protein
MGNADFGLESINLLANPKSAFPNPPCKSVRPGGLRVAGALFRPTRTRRAALRVSGRSFCFSRLIKIASDGFASAPHLSFATPFVTPCFVANEQ